VNMELHGFAGSEDSISGESEIGYIFFDKSSLVVTS